ATFSFKEVAGRYDCGEQTLYINVGLGCTAPFRIGVNPEVTVITLNSQASEVVGATRDDEGQGE
ncbi:MAG: metallophosphoesterase, partial [Alistipes sp.]|nr:metallophosphoesterase [Alistipes sp.]